MKKYVQYNRVKDIKTTYKLYSDGSLRLLREKKNKKGWELTHDIKLLRADIEKISIIYKEFVINNLDKRNKKWTRKVKELLKSLRN